MLRTVVKGLALFSIVLFVIVIVYIATRPVGVPVKILFISIVSVSYGCGIGVYAEIFYNSSQ